MIFIHMGEGQFDLLTEMVANQDRRNQEQFATMFLSKKKDEYNADYYEVEDMNVWPSYNLETQAWGELAPSEQGWENLIENLKTKNMTPIIEEKVSAILTVHTHPHSYGTREELNVVDEIAFKDWTTLFKRHYGVDMFNGIISSNGSLRIWKYNIDTNSFDRNIIAQSGNEIIKSTIPKDGFHRR